MQKTNHNGNKKKESRRNDKDLVAYLEVTQGREKNDVLALNQISTSMGCNQDADWVLLDEGVLKDHARIDLIAGSYTLTKLNPKAQLWINDTMTDQGNLHAGDVLRLGNAQLVFQLKSIHELHMLANSRLASVKDESSGLANKVFFEETLKREIVDAQRMGHDASCVILGLDKQAFDRLDVKKIASVLQKTTRIYDLVGRHEHDLFSVFLKNTALDNSLIFCKRLQKVFKETFDLNVYMGVKSIDRNASIGAKQLLDQALMYQQQCQQRKSGYIVSQRNI